MAEHAELFSPEWWSLTVERAFDWASTHGLRIVVICVLLVILLRVSRHFVERAIKLSLRPRGRDPLQDLMIAKRQTTLIKLFQAVASVTLVVLAVLMVFQEIGFAVGPILASAGIAGVAIGFGAQSLVKDIITGSFVILEQQFSVGDVIQVGNLSGGVEELNLRTVVLRAADGSVHIIPHGEIKQVTVLTRDWSRLVLDIDIAYDADIDTACGLMKKVLDDYAAANGDVVLEAPEVLGVQNLGENSVQLRAQMKVLPGKQWAAGRELRASIKKALDEAGIEIPFPQRTLWVRRQKS